MVTHMKTTVEIADDLLAGHGRQSRVAEGCAVHDARIAALCLHHGVKKLLSADRDFSRFPQLVTANPLRQPEAF